MHTAALEAQGMVRRAAEPVRPGETIKAQMRRAERALGYGAQDRWRIRAAWYGEAGSWNVGAFFDLKQRYDGWAERQSARLDSERARLCRLREALSEIDPDFHSHEIDALDRAIHAFDRGDQATGDR